MRSAKRLPTPGIVCRRAASPAAIDAEQRRRPACRRARSSAVRGPSPFTLRSRWKSARSRGVGEAEELDRVLAHLGVDEEPHARARRRQVGEGLQRDVHRVADAADVDDEPLGRLLGERAGERARSSRAPAPRAPARRRASGASLEVAERERQRVGRVGRRAGARARARSVTPRPTASLSAGPWPDRGELHRGGRVLVERHARRPPTAASTAPRASPRRNALCTLRATKARSSTTTDGRPGRRAARRHSACRRASRAASVVDAAERRSCRSRGAAAAAPRSRPRPSPSPGFPGRSRAPAPHLHRSPSAPPRRRHADSRSSSSAAMSMFDDTRLHVVVILERLEQAHHLLGVLAR